MMTSMTETLDDTIWDFRDGYSRILASFCDVSDIRVQSLLALSKNL